MTLHVADTSSLIDLQSRYPPDLFPSLWAIVERRIAEGKLVAPREVLRELEKRNDELLEWVKTQDGFILTDEETQDLIPEARRIRQTYPMLEAGGRRHPNPRSADPWVVALAKSRQAAVITEEQSDPRQPDIRYIPDACKAEGIPSKRLLAWLRDIGLKL